MTHERYKNRLCVYRRSNGIYRYSALKNVRGEGPSSKKGCESPFLRDKYFIIENARKEQSICQERMREPFFDARKGLQHPFVRAENLPPSHFF